MIKTLGEYGWLVGFTMSIMFWMMVVLWMRVEFYKLEIKLKGIKQDEIKL